MAVIANVELLVATTRCAGDGAALRRALRVRRRVNPRRGGAGRDLHHPRLGADWLIGLVGNAFSLYVNLPIERMQQFARAGITMNFTFDELSPLMGFDPYAMYEAIRAVGTDWVTLSSDCGEPLFPNSVEGMRMIIAYMKVYGLTEAEIEQVTVTNPRRLVGSA